MSFLDKKSSVKLNSGQLVPAFALVGEDGNQISDFSTSAGIVSVTEVEINNDSGNPIPTVSGFEIPKHNQVSLAYSGTNVVGVAYSFNNVGVATLTLSYDGNNNLISIIRS
jgi:hypothetical protein